MILQNFSLVPELSGGLDGRGLAMELKDGKIAALFADTEPVAETAFDCGGRTLLPGFLDIHTHLNGLGRDRDADVNVPMKVLVSGDPVADLSVVCGKPDYVFQAGRLVRDNTKEA